MNAAGQAAADEGGLARIKTMNDKAHPESAAEPDHRILSFGGGKQSTVMLLMAAEGAFGAPPDIALFSDTRWEPEHVYRHIEWVKSVSDIPIRTLSSGRDLRAESAGEHEPGEDLPVLRLPLYVIGENGSRGMLQHRQCTDIFKLRPIERFVRTTLYGLRPRQRMPGSASVEMWLGISTDEAQRMRDNHNSWAKNRYPLIEAGLSRADCDEWFAERYPGRPLPRSACSGCPFRSDSEWLALKNDSPRDFAEAARVDREIRRTARERGLRGTPFLHQRRLPVEEAVAAYERHLEMNPMLPGLATGAGNDCTAACFT